MLKNIDSRVLLLILATGVVLALVVSEAAPGRNSGKKGSIGGGGWFGKKTNQNSGWGTNYAGGTYRKKGSGMKTLKKAAVIGAVAYGGYQLGKLSGRFGGYGSGYGYGFNDWNRWREIDGFMCRDSNDCNWIDRNLYCQDYELDFTPSNLWFGGDVARIVGECACPRGMVWDNREMECEMALMSGTFMIVGVVIFILISFCCCCGCFVFLRRFM